LACAFRVEKIRDSSRRLLQKKSIERLPTSFISGMLVDAMKNRIGVVVLVLMCLGLGIGLIGIRREAARQKNADEDKIQTFSNQLVVTSGKYDEQKQVAALLEKDLDSQKKSYVELTNNFSDVSANLTKTTATLESTKKELEQRETKIAELESQNQALDKQAIDLSTAITNLTMEIADTQKKLAASEGDKAFLEKELQRLIGEKADLERQFNDLTVLRAQVAKLKEELSVARRLDWIRKGLFAATEEKGAQKLMQPSPAQLATKQATPKPNYDLNVEVTADGSVRVIPPATNGTGGASSTARP
jgi:septal ring factor EnvC (AmiA/AmiB activator)